MTRHEASLFKAEDNQFFFNKTSNALQESIKRKLTTNGINFLRLK